MITNPFIKYFEYPNIPLSETIMPIITKDQLLILAPRLGNNVDIIINEINTSTLNTKLRLAHFLAQVLQPSDKCDYCRTKF
jgi:predicted chitinase